ncbi:MAG TPA: caspase family protein, partial [Dongiaceae bacterium]|nr:caspase family protein [Dongiaceae bacterium]
MPPPDDRSLVLDLRQDVPGPGMHAILIGVSEYEYLPGIEDPGEEGLKALKKLASPALSAFRFEQKLVALNLAGQLPKPLKTVRLLLAPSAYELASEPGIANRGAAPTKVNIKTALRAWRQSMAESSEAVGLFYFGGHGIRRALEESILLAADFLDPEEVQLENCFRLSNVRAGMVPSVTFPDIGRTQFYFVDACRDKPDALDTMDDTQTPKIFDAALNTLDDRKAPIYFATYAGGFAAGNPGEETYFYKAIDWALDHASSESAS